MVSGVVRFGTLALRSGLVFCLASAIGYFALLLFEMYTERLLKKTQQLESEVEGEEISENSAENAEEGFQSTENYPNANG